MKALVFTAILGGSDALKPAPSGADRCVCFTDQPDQDPQGWELIRWDPTANPRREAWRLRCVPHTLFSVVHDVTVWVDASFTVTNLPKLLKDAQGYPLSGLRHHARTSCYQEGAEIIRIQQSEAAPVQAQLRAYQAVGFHPQQLTISCILVRAHTPKVQAFNERWDAEIQQHPGDNTQLSIDYAAWVNGLTWHHLTGVRKDNPYAVHDHADHKRRRTPYR